MLDIVPSTESRPRSMMTLDLSPYLLSASPPGSDFSLHSLSLTSNYSPYSFFSSPPSRSPPACPKIYGTSYAHSTPLKSIMSVNSKDSEGSSESTHSVDGSSSGHESTSSTQSGKKTKRVSFADDAGRPLTEVRVMLDNPTAPPLLAIRGLAGISRAGRTAAVLTNGENLVPPLIAPEPQPLERPNFEEDLRRNMVAVENVIVRGYDLTCTIFINNRPASKRVFGRCTTDSWQTFQDVMATHSQTRRPGYDTYQFTFQVPSSADRSKAVQFAVCYEADGVQHWDNNSGSNFTVHWNRDTGADTGAELQKYSEDLDADPLDYGGLVWCAHDDLDHPYY